MKFTGVIRMSLIGEQVIAHVDVYDEEDWTREPKKVWQWTGLYDDSGDGEARHWVTNNLMGMIESV